MPLHTRGLAGFVQRFVEDESGCWIWTGGCNSYGRPTFGKKPGTRSSPETAARASYRLFIGEINPGYHVHHLCGRLLCVNPEHLEAVDPQEHYALHHEEPTGSCIAGHDRAIFSIRRGGGQLVCRECDRERQARRRALARRPT